MNVSEQPDVPDNETEPARQSAAAIGDALRVINQLSWYGRDLCPERADRREWALAVLRDLAGAVDSLDRAVEQVSGRRNYALRRHTHLLATVIEAHRNVSSRAGTDVASLGDADLTPKQLGPSASGPAPSG